MARRVHTNYKPATSNLAAPPSQLSLSTLNTGTLRIEKNSFPKYDLRLVDERVDASIQLIGRRLKSLRFLTMKTGLLWNAGVTAIAIATAFSVISTIETSAYGQVQDGQMPELNGMTTLKMSKSSRGYSYPLSNGRYLQYRQGGRKAMSQGMWLITWKDTEGNWQWIKVPQPNIPLITTTDGGVLFRGIQ